VGKTSLVHRYTSGQFSASAVPSTIGASFLTKKLIIDGVKVRLQLWDTAGQERFRSMVSDGARHTLLLIPVPADLGFIRLPCIIVDLTPPSLYMISQILLALKTSRLGLMVREYERVCLRSAEDG
jgi:hypothetical protein